MTGTGDKKDHLCSFMAQDAPFREVGTISLLNRSFSMGIHGDILDLMPFLFSVHGIKGTALAGDL